MKAIIYYNGAYQDEITVYADTFEELKERALSESDSRGWERKYCWSTVDKEDD